MNYILLSTTMSILSFSFAILLLAGALYILFNKKNGILRRSIDSFSQSTKVLTEDALKYIFDCEYKNNPCSINALKGHLQLSDNKTVDLVEELTTSGLITLNHNLLQLTEEGRNYALKVIRSHRIWEKYLAEETSVSANKWHDEACKKEHSLSEEELEKLSARMGNPIMDPHGDPIPSSTGYIPITQGTTLDKMYEKERVRVVHIEDEPSYIYKQLLVLNLHPGSILYIQEVDDEGVRFTYNGNEFSISPILAAQITVKEVEEIEDTTEHEVLYTLPFGRKAKIVGISPNCRGLQRRRLMDMGVVPDAEIKALYKSASGDPYAYEIMNTTIGIRKDTTRQIYIKELDE